MSEPLLRLQADFAGVSEKSFSKVRKNDTIVRSNKADIGQVVAFAAFLSMGAGQELLSCMIFKICRNMGDFGRIAMRLFAVSRFYFDIVFYCGGA